MGVKWVKHVGFSILLTYFTPICLDGLNTLFLTYFHYFGFSALGQYKPSRATLLLARTYYK